MKKVAVKTKWIDFHPHQNSSPCYSCGVKNCQVSLYAQMHRELNDKQKMSNWVNFKTHKMRVISECSKYKEQIFDVKKEDEQELEKRIGALLDFFCWSAVQGQHNVSQSNDGWDDMLGHLERGLKYALTHRKAFNQIMEWSGEDD